MFSEVIKNRFFLERRSNDVIIFNEQFLPKIIAKHFELFEFGVSCSQITGFNIDIKHEQSPLLGTTSRTCSLWDPQLRYQKHRVNHRSRIELQMVGTKLCCRKIVGIPRDYRISLIYRLPVWPSTPCFA